MQKYVNIHTLYTYVYMYIYVYQMYIYVYTCVHICHGLRLIETRDMDNDPLII